MASVQINSIDKSFGTFQALNQVTLDIPDGAFVSLLGPSGCGKTTLLRIIAGLETATSGDVIIDGTPVTGLAPEHRDLAMMFQSYALLPHMSVLENVRFPLRMRGNDAKAAQYERAREALEMVKLDHLADRRPRQLSGGQQQRVALARAIVARPRVLLLDEPLSNLDARLREDMQIELIQLHKTLGFTTIFVTHDQEEALSLSDLVVLMQAGRIEQSGAPRDLYAAPGSAFAADFIGAANLIEAEIQQSPEGWTARITPTLEVAIDAPPDGRTGRRHIALRQESATFSAEGPVDGMVAAPAVLETAVFLGGKTRYITRLGSEGNGPEVKILSPADTRTSPPSPGPGHLSWMQDAIRVVD
ncbi:ABC transporter ATP-binding protein [Fodinicurvata sp. EGI_FJ10296]|uniref:ABC transporter ATP-binding protein n=1 Tax=Fodinicurvata sp. EGI_FJ10296 TaxID=3231908 RepID=UPI003456ED9D